MIRGDDQQIQRERIELIVKELSPNAEARFDPDSTWIRFRIVDKLSGTVLMPSSGEWKPSELGEKSDDWIRQAIGALSGGRVGIRTFRTGQGYRARYGGYDIIVEARDDGWYWSVKDRDTGQIFDSPQHVVEAEEAKKAAALFVGTLTGEMTLGNRVTLGDVYKKIQWTEL
jgi:hypothetical protein